MSYGYGEGQDSCLIKIEHELGTFYMSVQSGDLSWVYGAVLHLMKEYFNMAPPRSMRSLKIYSDGGAPENRLDLLRALFPSQEESSFSLPGSSDRWVSMAGRGWWAAAGRVAQFEAEMILHKAETASEGTTS